MFSLSCSKQKHVGVGRVIYGDKEDKGHQVSRSGPGGQSQTLHPAPPCGFRPCLSYVLRHAGPQLNHSSIFTNPRGQAELYHSHVLGHSPTGWHSELQTDFLPCPGTSFVTVNLPGHQRLCLTLIMATRPDPHPHHDSSHQGVNFPAWPVASSPRTCLTSWALGWPRLPPRAMPRSLTQG